MEPVTALAPHTKQKVKHVEESTRTADMRTLDRAPVAREMETLAGFHWSRTHQVRMAMPDVSGCSTKRKMSKESNGLRECASSVPTRPHQLVIS